MTDTLASWWERLNGAPKATSLVLPDKTIRRSDLLDLVGRFCAAFDAADLREGDRVLILMPDEAVAIAAFVAALLDGLVPVMLTPDTPAERAAGIAQSVDPALAVVSSPRRGEDWLAGGRRLLVLEEAGAPRRWLARRPSPGEELARRLSLPWTPRAPRLPSDPDGLAYVLFTSGTTSNPSGVMIRRRNLLANVSTISRVLGIDESSRIFNDMVLAHGDGLVQGPLMMLGTGCTLIRAGGFSVDGIEDWLATVRREGSTHFITVPTVWSMIERYAQHDDYFAGPGFRTLSSVAAYLNPELWERLERRFGHPLTNQYGLTETVASALYAGPHPEAGARFSVGRPIDCEARIMQVHAGEETGELQLRGENVFGGYWQDDERTSRTFTGDGWMRTGDLARPRPDGSFDIVGRLKTVIMSGGFLIRPEEVDEAMLRHPAVISSVTVGVEDGVFGEVPMTVVEAPSGTSEPLLAAHARAVLEPLKVPKRIFITGTIPRGDAGKPSLDRVRQIVAGHLVTAGGPDHGPGSTPDLAAVIETAARVFRVDPSSLSSRSSPDSVPGWDSFAQISLVLALEERFGLRIPARRAASIRSLASALEALGGAAR